MEYNSIVSNSEHVSSHMLRSEATPTGERCDPLTLQALMEKVVLLRKAVQRQRKQQQQQGGGGGEGGSKVLGSKLWQYASLLASQGALETAYSYLMQDGDVSGGVVRGVASQI